MEMGRRKYTGTNIQRTTFILSFSLNRISYVRVDTEDSIKVHEFPWILKIRGDISAYPYDIPSIPLCRVRTTVYACVRIYASGLHQSIHLGFVPRYIFSVPSSIIHSNDDDLAFLFSSPISLLLFK